MKITVKRAIEILDPTHREHYNEIPDGIEQVNEACRMGVQALKRLIPQKPDYEGDGYDENGNIIYDTWLCPCCGHKYEVDYDNFDFCPNCGQALKECGENETNN